MMRFPLSGKKTYAAEAQALGMICAHMQCKVDAIEGYGGIITPCAPTLESREAVCAEVMARTGTTFIPPYNYGPTICGQGTIALEFLTQAGSLLSCALAMCFVHLRWHPVRITRMNLPSVCA